MNKELKDIEPLKKGQLSIFKAAGGGKSTIKEILNDRSEGSDPIMEPEEVVISRSDWDKFWASI